MQNIICTKFRKVGQTQNQIDTKIDSLRVFVRYISNPGFYECDVSLIKLKLLYQLNIA